MASMNVMDARRYRNVGRGAAVVLALSAAVLWGADVPWLGGTLPARQGVHGAAVVDDRPASAAQAARLDREAAELMAGRLEEMAKVKKEAPIVEVLTAELPDPVPEGPTWAYLGPIQESSRLLALVTVDGHQKVIAEGRRYAETRLVSVMSDEIIVEDGAGRRHIPRSDRGEMAPRVAWVKTMPGNAPPQGAQVNGAAGQMSAEVKQRLIAQGMDPRVLEQQEQAQRYRQAMRERRNRGREGQVPITTPVSAVVPGMNLDATGMPIRNGQEIKPKTDDAMPQNPSNKPPTAAETID